MGQSGRFTHVMIYWTVWDRFIQVLYLGRAPRTKETLPDFLKWRRVTRHPLVFHGLTNSQRTLGFWGVINYYSISNGLHPQLYSIELWHHVNTSSINLLISLINQLPNLLT